MLAVKSNFVRGLLLLGTYVAAVLVFRPLYDPVASIVLVLIALFFCFWIPGLLAEAAGLKPSQQFWFAFGSLGAYLGAITATLGIVRLSSFIRPIQYPLAFAIGLSVVVSAANLSVLLLLFKLFVQPGASLVATKIGKR